MARDNTVSYDNRVLQIEKTKWRYSLAGYNVKVYEHLDGTISLSVVHTSWVAMQPAALHWTTKLLRPGREPKQNQDNPGT